MAGEELLIAAGRFIIQNLPWFGTAIAEVSAGVTNIKRIQNETIYPLRLAKIDVVFPNRPVYEEIVVGRYAVKETEFWMPWAQDATDYARKHAGLQLGNTHFAWLWQKDGRLKFSGTDAFNAAAPDVPGVARGGGNRTLVVRMVNGRPAFVIAGIPLGLPRF
jgi:hypothetical protein